MTFRIIIPAAITLFLTVLALPATADVVVPRDSVVNHVNVRSAADGDSEIIGQLQPGEHLTYVRSVPRWHEVVVDADQTGFVSKSWTDVIAQPLDPKRHDVLASIHFLDVGTGDSAIIDMGDREVIIDGGDSKVVLNNYARRTGIIDGPIELVIVTHGDTDHWNGLRRLLGFDGVEDDPFTVLEYWDPGYNRDCNPSSQGGRRNYLKFVEDMEESVPAAQFHRPLEDHHTPAVASGEPEPMELSGLPAVGITVLHTDSNPTEGSCSYKINNASIVLMLDIEGFRFLFTGDANGKERDEASPGTPGHVEKKLLDLELAHPGTLKAVVLKVPHHGSETASTQSFIDAVDPDFVAVSASTKHHLPKSTVMDRYDDGERIILQTDVDRSNDTDHIVCIIRSPGDIPGSSLDCNFAEVFSE